MNILNFGVAAQAVFDDKRQLQVLMFDSYCLILVEHCESKDKARL